MLATHRFCCALLLILLPRQCSAECKPGDARSVDVIFLTNWEAGKQGSAKVEVVARQRAPHMAVHNDKEHLDDKVKTFSNVASEFYRLCTQDACGLTKEICETQAALHSLDLGSNEYPFDGYKFPDKALYYEKGCYAYYAGDFAGKAFYGYLDDQKTAITSEEQLNTLALPKFRVPGTFKCTEEKCVAPLNIADAENGWCEADSASQEFGVNKDKLDKGEAAQVRAAVSKSLGGKDKPGDVGLEPKEDWVEYLSSHSARHALKITVRHGGMTSMAYAVPLTDKLEEAFKSTKAEKNEGALYRLSCQDANDPRVFEQADVIKQLNAQLNLWPGEDCPTGQLPLQPEGGGSGTILIICVVLLLLAAGGGAFFWYTKKNGSAPSKNEAQQQQVELSSKINSYQNSV